MTPQLAIILPTLNERDNVAPLIARIDAALPDTSWQAIIVDDNSEDGTAEEARRIAAADARIRVIERFGRTGLASAAIEGICAADARLVAVMDADHQHDPGLLPTMIEAVEKGACDLAIASRFMPGASPEGLASERREKGSRLANAMARRFTGSALTDPMSGYFLMRTKQARKIVPRLSGIGFKLLFDVLTVSGKSLKVQEFPLEFAERAAGESKLDRAVALDFLVAIYDRLFGWLVPTRFALFGTVGALGVGVHLCILALLYPGMTATFWKAQAVATFAAMTFNFLLNNWLTYRDKRLRGAWSLLRGWAGFCLTCAMGALANVAVASLLQSQGLWWLAAGLAGIVVGAVWNYALSSRFVWGRY